MLTFERVKKLVHDPRIYQPYAWIGAVCIQLNGPFAEVTVTDCDHVIYSVGSCGFSGRGLCDNPAPAYAVEAALTIVENAET